ncbi:MAG: TIGR01777 family oxidoreductase [Cyclobacteriaceae bacterium]
MKKIVIAGGSGFLGSCLTRYYREKECQIYVLSRHYQEDEECVRYIHWDGKHLDNWVKVLEGADALINLSGKSVDCRYTKKNKALIYASRLDSTRVLGEAIQRSKIPPKVWVNAASATIYRHTLDIPMDEVSGEYGTGFSVDVCQKWEGAFSEIEVPGTRKIVLRTGIVLGKSGGALQPLLNLVKIGLGGKQGRGNQYFSWLHELDFVRIISFLINQESASGVFNAVAPNPLPNKQFMKKLRAIHGIPVGVPLPVWLLKIGTRIIHTETELILKSRRVIPTRLLNEGFQFEYPEPNGALNEIIHRHKYKTQSPPLPVWG